VREDSPSQYSLGIELGEAIDTPSTEEFTLASAGQEELEEYRDRLEILVSSATRASWHEGPGKPGRKNEHLRDAVERIAPVYEKVTGGKFGRTTYKGDRGEIFVNDVLKALDIKAKPSAVRAAIDAFVTERRQTRRDKRAHKS
jgi:hypothetical protein